jgi:hypothetical protein
MNTKTFSLLLVTLAFICIFFNFGCGKYLVQYSAPDILSISPTIDATGIASNEQLWIKFSKAMDPGDITMSGLGKRFIWASDMTATTTFFAELTPEAYWTEENTKLILNNIFFINSPGTHVHIIASLEGFSDTDGKFLPEGTSMWKYDL